MPLSVETSTPPTRPPVSAAVPVTVTGVPTGTVARHRHTAESLDRKVGEVESIAVDLRRADADYRERGVESDQFPPQVSALCGWCDFRAHCPEGQTAGPKKSGWAALEPAEKATVPRAIEVD